MATWTDLTFAYGSLLTSTKMSQLDANLDALAEGASGAPTITTTAIGSGCVTSYNIADGAVTATEIQSNVVQGFQHFVNSVTTTVLTLAAGGTQVFSAGVFAIHTFSGSSSALPNEAPIPYCVEMTLQYRHAGVAATWHDQTNDSGVWVTVWSDGTNFRVENTDSERAAAVLFRKL